MAQRDYYDILGIARSASADEIKSAYRKLARKFHPDVSKAPDAERRFAEVQEAYAVLSDEQKRKLYDQFGHAGPASASGAGAWSGGGAGGGRAGFDVDVDDLGSMFDTFFGAPGAGGGFRTGRGGRTAGPAGRRPRSAAPTEVELPLSFLTAARGGKERVRLTVGGKETSLEVAIPPAVEPGARLRVRGVDGAEVLLRVRVGGHPVFRRGEGPEAGKGLDLYLELPLTIAEATLGAKVGVPTLEGAVDLTVPPDSPSGRKLRVRGRGLKDQTGRTGDLYAVVRIVPPESGMLSSAEREALGRIAGHTPPPRRGSPWPPATGAPDERTE